MKEKRKAISSKDEDFDSVPYISIFWFLSVSIRVNPWFRSVPVLCCGSQKNRGERSIPGCGAGMESLGRVDGGATGGMSADILLARNIAAAKARRQFLLTVAAPACGREQPLAKSFSAATAGPKATPELDRPKRTMPSPVQSQKGLPSRTPRSTGSPHRANAKR
jgi:hypothetical protein